MTTEMNRRLYGLLSKRLDEARFDEVADGRDDRGKRWSLGALLRATVGGILSGFFTPNEAGVVAGSASNT